jgi:hypothetical protein
MEGEMAARSPDLEAMLCRAICNRKVVKFRYKNEFSSRTFQPYVVYESSAKKFLIGGIQTKDDSKPLKPPEWRAFEIALIYFATVTNETFQPDRGFKSFRPEFGQNVICAVDRI